MPFSSQPAPLSFNYAGLSDQGRVRENNEDAWLAGRLELALLEPAAAGAGCLALADGALLAVSDGLGGAAAGEVASRLAVMELHTRLALRERGPVDLRFARDLIAATNQILLGVSRSTAAWRGMGATLSFIWAEGSSCLLGQVGDSRIYRWRDGNLVELTTDHSPVGRLRQSGELSEQQAREHPQRHLIDQCLGGDVFTVMPDLAETDIRAGDMLLLCSDGLTDGVTDAEIALNLASGADPTRDLMGVAQQLVAAGNQAGGRDNITALVARVEPASSGC